MEQQRIKFRTKFSSSILKFKLKKKVAKNGAVTSISNGKITSLENLAAEYKKAKSMMELGMIELGPHKKKNVQRMEIQAEQEQEPVFQELDSLFAGSSKSSISSLLEDEQENYYQTSVVACTTIKESEQLIDKDLIHLLSFIKQLQVPPLSALAEKQVEFGEYTRHKTLIWDLDETLVHAQLILPSQYNSVADFQITLKNGAKFAVTIRPYVHKCLDYLFQYYEMAVFTAAEQEYADLIIDQLDPDRKIFCKRLYRQHCVKTDDVYIKDLRVIADREIEDIIIVDNCIISFGFQISNGIPICAFFSQNKFQDQEMLYLLTYLEEVYSRKDFRDANKQTFKLEDLMSKIS